MLETLENVSCNTFATQYEQPDIYGLSNKKEFLAKTLAKYIR